MSALPATKRSSWRWRRLYEAADEDTATGGPDPIRGIYPVVATVDAEGYRRLEDAEVAEHFRHVLEHRRERGEGGVSS